MRCWFRKFLFLFEFALFGIVLYNLCVLNIFILWVILMADSKYIEKVSLNDLNIDLDSYGESYLINENIYDFLKFCRESGGMHKLAGIITNKQRVFNVARRGDHWSLMTEVCQAAFPKRLYDFNNLYHDGVEVYSVGYDLTMWLPMEVSQMQYDSIVQMIDQVKQFEEEYDTKVEYFNVDYTLEQAKKRLADVERDDFDEVIVGVPLTEDLQNEFSNKEETIKKY